MRGVLVYNTYSTICISKPSSYYMSMRKLVGFRKNHMRKRRNYHISINSYYRKNKGAIYNGFPPQTNVVLTSVPCLETLCGQHRAKSSTNKKKVFCKNVIRDGVCNDRNCIHSHNIEDVSSGENFVVLLEHGINFAMKKDGFRHLIMQHLKKNIPLDALYVKHVKQFDDDPNKFEVVRYYNNDEPNDSKIWKLRDETSSALVFYGEGINDSEVRKKIRDLIHEISAKFKAKMYPVKKYPCSPLVKNSFDEDGKKISILKTLLLCVTLKDR